MNEDKINLLMKENILLQYELDYYNMNLIIINYCMKNL
jgi:hypothetical protein